MLLRVRKPSRRFSRNWLEILVELEEYCPRTKVTKVLWEYPPKGRVKHNTNEASRGNRD